MSASLSAFELPALPDPESAAVQELLQRRGGNGPRYTSYPTADRFLPAGTGFNAGDYRAALTRAGNDGRPLSLYFHVPFCATLCYYCGCNKIGTKDRTKADDYLAAVEREMDLVVALLGREGLPVEQLHWGGGTPTFLTLAQRERLFGAVLDRFSLSEDAECSIEIDPRSVTPAEIAHLRRLGFNRASVGVQDFTPEVQRAVNRWQPYEMTAQVVGALRAEGFQSTNFDLIYGLPKQTPETFTRTLEQTIELRPDRIAVYQYAHLPSLFMPQQRIVEADLPPAAVRLQLLTLAIKLLTAAGYVYVGMDHFALPEDELAQAMADGRMHRNFQGYSTRSELDLIAFGVSAISMVDGVYHQNQKALDGYYQAIAQRQLPSARGYAMTHDDRVRRSAIQALMCRFRLDKADLAQRYDIDFDSYFQTEIANLKAFQADGLVTVDDEGISVTPLGRLLIRPIAMVFDRHLREATSQNRYSKVA